MVPKRLAQGGFDAFLLPEIIRFRGTTALEDDSDGQIEVELCGGSWHGTAMLDHAPGTTPEPTPPGRSDPFSEASPPRTPDLTCSACPHLAVCVNPKTFLERF